MTTSEFIKMLQNADPTGNAHVRLSDGMPWFAELKQGYWDGAYSYLDEDENYVTSIRGDKVDVVCMGLEDFVENNFRYHNENNWDEVKNKLKFDWYGYHPDTIDDRSNRKIEQAKKYWDENYESAKERFNESTNEMIFNAGLGWRWFQNKLVENKDTGHNYFYYQWIVIDENGKESSSNVHMTEPVLYSGLWERFDSEEKPDYFEWKINLEKLNDYNINVQNKQ